MAAYLFSDPCHCCGLLMVLLVPLAPRCCAHNATAAAAPLAAATSRRSVGRTCFIHAHSQPAAACLPALPMRWPD